LHPFAACLIPEVYSESIRPRKIVLIEGILLLGDATWSGKIIWLSDDDFQNWLFRFRSVSDTTLKSQLVSKPSKDKLVEWSNAFRIASSDALRGIAGSMNERLSSGFISKTFDLCHANLFYVVGSRGRFCINDSTSKGIIFYEIENSGYFPVIDNPAEVANIILDNISPVT
jgi:hypothetical protein